MKQNIIIDEAVYTVDKESLAYQYSGMSIFKYKRYETY